ncbi:PAS domain S-box protein, partial [bacterium]|nr:PAS domain S-box protein [bacterium]
IDITERKKAEEELKESEEKYRGLADSIGDMFFSLDKNLKYTFRNKKANEFFGLSAEDTIGKSPFDILSDTESTDMMMDFYREVLETKQPNNVVNHFMKDGKKCFLDFRIYPFKDGISVIAKDITELKKYEESTRESEEKYRSLVEVNPSVIYRLDNKGAITFISSRISEIIGYKSDEIIGKDISEIIYKNDSDKIKHVNEKRTGARATKRLELRLKGKEGIKDIEMRYVGVNANGIYENGYIGDGKIESRREPKGAFIGTQGTITDITERRKAEENLKESEEKLRNIFENSTNLFYSHTPDHIFTYLSPQVEDMLGYTVEEAMVKWTEFTSDNPINEDGLKKTIAAIESGKAQPPYELELVRKDGKKVMLEIHEAPVVENGKTVAIVGAATNITERKRLEEQLQIRQRMDSLGTLAGGIAHDFNNLLVGIMGNIDMLNVDSDGLTELQKEYLNNATKSSERAASLIRQFQMFSKGFVTGKVSVDVYEVADEVFSILKKTTDRLIKKKINFIKEKFIINANSSELHQVFMNLGMNAVYAIEEKGVKRGDYISIKAEDCSITGTDITGLSEGEYVHIIFEDSGTGMTDEVRRKAFDPLFTTKEMGTQKGQGLGLAMVYNIVTRNHGGHITIESSVGKGTTFHIYLPKTHSEAQAIPEEIMGVAGGDETVLIIEDEDIILKLVRNILEKSGYTVLTAEDGEKGLDIHKKKKDSIDLVILDLTMPEMSGQMVFEKMLKIDPKVKVIISSGHSEEETRKGILSLAKGYLEKPYKIRELAQAVRAVLDTWD